MALKRKINAEEFGALPELMQAEYKAHGEGYVLDTDDATELETALRRTQEEARDAKARLDAIQAEKDAANAALAAAEEEAARKKGDVTALEASWKKKVEDATAAGTTEAESLRAKLRQLLVKNKALELATEISTVPDLILPHIERRLEADLDGDEPATRVLDTAGKPSALTLDDLKQEFVANDKYAAIIIGSNASGGQSANNRNTGQPGHKKISEMTEAERVAEYGRVGATEFNRRVAAERAA